MGKVISRLYIPILLRYGVEKARFIFYWSAFAVEYC